MQFFRALMWNGRSWLIRLAVLRLLPYRPVPEIRGYARARAIGACVEKKNFTCLRNWLWRNSKWW